MLPGRRLTRADLLASRLSCLELDQSWVLREPLNKEVDLLAVHFELFTPLVVHILRLGVKALLEDIDNLAARSHDEVVQLPVGGILVAADSGVDLVIE